jgi:predicted acyltransferase
MGGVEDGGPEAVRWVFRFDCPAGFANLGRMDTPAPKSERLLSLDALRGFDLFWILGGEGVVHALLALTGWAWVAAVSAQLKHVAWNGFQAYDLIFPTFLFLAGVSTPFSLRHRLGAENRKEVVRKIVRRGLILVLLGIIYNNGLQWKGLDQMRFASVLGRIGLAGMFAQLIFLFNAHRLRRLWWWLGGLLVGYYVVMITCSAPGYARGDLTLEGNFASYVDRLILPGKLHRGTHDPEGLFSTIPAIATALLGVFAGLWLQRPNEEATPWRKARRLALAGLVCLAGGGLWDYAFPINKNLWTSSFVLWAGGWSFLLLALFYWTIDVRGWAQRFGAFFAVVGMNSIFIYMAGRFIDFGYTSKALFGGLAKTLPDAAQPLALAIGLFAVEWALLWLMQRQKWVLRV